MSYELEALKRTTSKNVLVRMKGSISLNDKLIIDSGSIYKVLNFNYSPYSETLFVKKNNVSLTRVYVDPSSDTEFSFNEDTKELKIYSSSGVNDSNYFTFDFSIYLTNGYDYYLPHNPSDTIGIKRHWQPRIASYPVFSQNISNLINPSLSLSVSNLSLIDSDNYFSKYLSNDISFYEKEIDVFHIINSQDNIRYIYTAKINRIEKQTDLLSISITDIFSKFDNDCYIEDVCKPGENSLYTFRTNIQPSKVDKPIPYVTSLNSYSNLNFLNQNITNMVPDAMSFDYYSDASIANIEEMLEAICFDYTTTLTVNNNRKFVIGVVDGDVEDYSFTPLAVNTSNPSFIRLTTTPAQMLKMEVGDWLQYTYLGNPRYTQVKALDFVNNYIWVGAGLGLTSPILLSYKKIPMAVISVTEQISYEIDDSGSTIIRVESSTLFNDLLEGKDFTTYLTPTGIGNSKVVWIKLNDNLEFTFNSPVFDPESNIKIYARIKPNRSNQNHADVLKKIVESAGFATNSSFAQAKLDLSINTSFTIPFRTQSSVNSYSSYAKSIMSSCLSHLYIDENGSIGYRLLSETYNNTDITDDDILDGSFSLEFDYSQIIGSLVLKNEHLDYKRKHDKSYFKGDTNASKYLNSNFNQDEFLHVLDDILILSDDHLKIRQTRKVYYSFSCAAKLFNANIGDNVTLYKSGLPGGVNSVVLKIISIDRTIDFVKIKAIDLQGL